MIKNMKKAFIDQIMLGLFLISSVIVFVATVSDEAKARSKYTDLKHIVQTAALSSSKYYTNVNNDTEEAQNIALGIIENSRLGIEVKDDMVMLDNAKVITTDIICSNGVIHVIDAVILPKM